MYVLDLQLFVRQDKFRLSKARVSTKEMQKMLDVCVFQRSHHQEKPQKQNLYHLYQKYRRLICQMFQLLLSWVSRISESQREKARVKADKYMYFKKEQWVWYGRVGFALRAEVWEGESMFLFLLFHNCHLLFHWSPLSSPLCLLCLFTGR